MSFSANQKIKKNAWNYLDKKYTDLKIDNFSRIKEIFQRRKNSSLIFLKLIIVAFQLPYQIQALQQIFQL